MEIPIVQTGLNHVCIACGKEHEENCCAFCPTHCYKCSKPKDDKHNQAECDAVWFGRRPPGPANPPKRFDDNKMWS